MTVTFALCAVFVLPARAELSAELPIDAVSTIGVARIADEFGDAVIGAWLSQSSRRDLTLFAVRAAPFANAPERMVAPLAKLACGRDPTIAPEAGQALSQLADAFLPTDLAAREVLLSDLRDAFEALACVRDAETRADIAFAAALLEARLQTLLPAQH